MARPRSDSFQTLLRLRESLNAGKRNKVTTYAFDDDRSPERVKGQGVKGRPGSMGEVEGRVGGQSGEKGVQQRHYRVMDTKSPMDEESPLPPSSSPVAGGSGQQQGLAPPTFSSPTCKYYSVPVEISLHRINVVDVDKPVEEMEILRTMSCNVRRNDKADGSSGTGVGGLGTADVVRPECGEGNGGGGEFACSKARSRSLGDMDDLESDDEVLLVRAPVVSPAHAAAAMTPPTSISSSLDSPLRQRSPVAPVHPEGEGRPLEKEEKKEGEEMSSLDFKARTEASGGVAMVSKMDHQHRLTHTRSIILTSGEGERERSWEPVRRVGSGKGGAGGMTLSRSLDNLVDAVPKAKAK